jgi:hypothetical protein
MAQSAVGAIRAGCQMLSEGKAEIGKFKKQVEGGVADAKAIYKEITGLWGWLSSLFGLGKQSSNAVVVKENAPAPKVEAPKPVAKKANQPEPELTYEAFQAQQVHEICENLKIYFEAIRQLKIHCRELEEEALTTEKVADSAIDRIEMQWQMAQLSAQLKQAMIWGTPEELGLGSMYQEFLLKYDEIVEEQEAARELKARKERNSAWRLEHRKEILIAKLIYVVAVAMGMIELIGLYFTL